MKNALLAALIVVSSLAMILAITCLVGNIVENLRSLSII